MVGAGKQFPFVLREVSSSSSNQVKAQFNLRRMRRCQRYKIKSGICFVTSVTNVNYDIVPDPQ